MDTILADAVLVVHFGIVLFVVGGLVLILLGNGLGWNWVNARWFRLAHLAAIGIVVAESWFGITCPLTTMEDWLRVQAGVSSAEKGFIARWVHKLLFYSAPDWVFTLVYTVFGSLVAWAWWHFPPKRTLRSSAAGDA